LKAQLARAEKERDEAKQAASERIRQMQNLEKRLSDASSFLNGLRNGGKATERWAWEIDEDVKDHR